MISAQTVLQTLRPLHVWVRSDGRIQSAGWGFAKLVPGGLQGQAFFDVFAMLQPHEARTMGGARDSVGATVRLHLRSAPDVPFRGLLVDDGAGGMIVDLSFGIAVVDAVREFGLTAQDFSPSDLAVELLFLQEAKSSAMAASFTLNARLEDARLAAEYQALTDGLTGLNNRRALDSALARLGHSKTPYAILNMDLDLFKAVNDTLGHAVGDAVLQRVAAIMRRHTRKSDLLVRAGGDEFVVLCPSLTDQARLTGLSNALIAEISRPFDIEGEDIHISASIGIGVSDHIADRAPDQIADLADIALYAAKRAGRGQAVIWSPQLGHRLSELPISHVATR